MAPASSPRSGTRSRAGSRTSYTVYALDRRGHGDSHKPAADRYHFQDFAEDVCAADRGARPVTDIYGIGHSAGATDLLLAAKLLPDRFARLFVMEPTVMDPRAARAGGASLSELANGRGAGRAAPPGRVRQRGRGVPALSGGARICELDRGRRCGPTSNTASQPLGGRPGAAALHARNRISHVAADLRSDGAGLCRRRARQSIRVAFRDRLPGAHRHHRKILGDLQGDGGTGGRADPGRQPVDVRWRRPLRSRRKRRRWLLAGAERRSTGQTRLAPALTKSSSLQPLSPDIPGINPALPRSRPRKPNQGS